MTVRRLDALIAGVREALRKEDIQESLITSMSNGEIAGCIEAAVHRLSEKQPCRKEILVRRALPLDDDWIVDAEDISAFVDGDTCTIANQPDTTRNVTIAITDADTSITDFQIDITGLNEDGEDVTESFLFASGLTQTGEEYFMSISSVEVVTIAGNGAGDVLDVGVGVDVDGSRQIKLSAVNVSGSLVDLTGEPYNLIKVTSAEYPISLPFRAYRNVRHITDDIIEVLYDDDLEYDDPVRLFYQALHTLNAQESTLNAAQAELVCVGATGYACERLATSFANRANVGMGAPERYLNIAYGLQSKFEQRLSSSQPVGVVELYPRS